MNNLVPLLDLRKFIESLNRDIEDHVCVAQVTYNRWYEATLRDTPTYNIHNVQAKNNLILRSSAQLDDQIFSTQRTMNIQISWEWNKHFGDQNNDNSMQQLSSQSRCIWLDFLTKPLQLIFWSFDLWKGELWLTYSLHLFVSLFTKYYRSYCSRTT